MQGDLEEKPQGDLLEGEDARTSYSYSKLHLIRTVKCSNFKMFLSNLALKPR